MNEYCETCTWWKGDSSGEIGYCCIDAPKRVLVGRYEECISYLANVLDIEMDLWT